MINVIKNKLVPVSELKKSPMKVMELAKSTGDAVYILNNNKDVGVVIDIDKFRDLVNGADELKKENIELNERLIYLETELRLANNKKTFSDSEVRGTDRMKADLSQVEDEWE